MSGVLNCIRLVTPLGFFDTLLWSKRLQNLSNWVAHERHSRFAYRRLKKMGNKVSTVDQNKHMLHELSPTCSACISAKDAL